MNWDEIDINGSRIVVTGITYGIEKYKICTIYLVYLFFATLQMYLKAFGIYETLK